MMYADVAHIYTNKFKVINALLRLIFVVIVFNNTSNKMIKGIGFGGNRRSKTV